MTDDNPTQRYDPPTAASTPAAPPPPAAPPAAFEPPAAATPVPTTPVAAGSSSRGGRGRLRWLLVGLVALVVAGTAAGATLLLTSDTAAPAVLTYAPADSVAYTELRLDLPGSQQAELAKVMSAFPGFDDQAAFPAKLNEALDQLVGKASDGKQSWTTDIDPWFGRQLSISVGPLPTSAEAGKARRGLLLANVTDVAKAQAWATKLTADHGATTSTETYNGVTITTVTSSDASMAGTTAGWAVFGPVLAVGDVQSVKDAIDTNGTSGLDTNAQFQTAEGSVSGDRLGFAYVDVKAATDAGLALAGDAGSAIPSMPAALADLAVPWTAAAIRAENGAFVVETRNPHLAATGDAKPSTTTLASVVPPTTVLLAEGHDVGEALTRFKDTAATQADLKDGVKQLEDALALVGGWDATVGWIGETGVAVTVNGDQIGGGIVITPTGSQDPARLFTQLRGFIGLAGAGAGITMQDEDYKGTPITTITISDVGALAGAATGGAAGGGGGAQPVTLSYAVTDQVVVIGLGTDFTKGVLDARTGDSLAKSPRFSGALQQAGATHSALLWLDVAGARTIAESRIPADKKAKYTSDVKPYLDAFDSVIATFTPAADLDRGTVIIRVQGT